MSPTQGNLQAELARAEVAQSRSPLLFGSGPHRCLRRSKRKLSEVGGEMEIVLFLYSVNC